MKFQYTAKNKQGKTVRGEGEYESQREALLKLKESGLRVKKIKMKKESAFTKKYDEWNSQFEEYTTNLFGARKKKKQMESFKEELRLLGYDRQQISAIMRSYTPAKFDVDDVSREYQLNTIQTEKIRAGKLSQDLSKGKKSSKLSDAKKTLSFSFGVPIDVLITFTEQFAILYSTGIDMVAALQTLQKNLKNKKLSMVISDLILNINEGKLLATSMEAHPDVFPPLYLSMVRVGEETGTELPTALNDLCKFLKMQQHLKREFIQASVYPAIVLVLMIGILIFMNYFLIQKRLFL